MGEPWPRTLRGELRAESAALTERLGFTPILAVLSVGDDPASRSYVAGIRRACERVGIACRQVELPHATTAAELRAAIDDLNAEREVCGVLATLPLPAHLPADHARRRPSRPEKDIDGITPTNAGRLALGWPTFAPNTPAGGMEILRRYGIPIAGQARGRRRAQRDRRQADGA